MAEAERRLRAKNRHSPHFRTALSAAVRSTSAFGWKSDPQICAILLGNRQPEIGGDDSGYSPFSPKADLHARRSAMRRWADLAMVGSERQLCATRRHSPHFRMAVSAAVRSTSAFGWKGDPQICAILLGNRRPEIGGGDSGYSRLSPNSDVQGVSGKVTNAPDPLPKPPPEPVH